MADKMFPSDLKIGMILKAKDTVFNAGPYWIIETLEPDSHGGINSKQLTLQNKGKWHISDFYLDCDTALNEDIVVMTDEEEIAMLMLASLGST